MLPDSPLSFSEKTYFVIKNCVLFTSPQPSCVSVCGDHTIKDFILGEITVQYGVTN
jgi:hypothetical protein